MKRLRSGWGWVGVVAILAGWPGVPVLAEEAAAKTASTAAATLIGLSREEVVALRGKPTGERQRGDTLVMVYPDGARIELQQGRVVSVSGGAGAGAGRIVGADGARYEPGMDGRPRRAVDGVEPAQPSEAAAAASWEESEEVPADERSVEEEAGQGVEQWHTGPATSATVAEVGTLTAKKGGPSPQGLEKAIDQAEEDAEDMATVGSAGDEPEESLSKRVVEGVLDAVIRFGFVVLVLRLALHFVGVPFFWPDLIKVCVLYLSVYEVLATLAGLGGLWEFFDIFKVPDVVSFIVLTCSLKWWKIAGSGITALKIAAMTKAVVVGLMLAAGLAIAFSL